MDLLILKFWYMWTKNNKLYSPILVTLSRHAPFQQLGILQGEPGYMTLLLSPQLKAVLPLQPIE